jgi:hypothetical protein
MMFTTFVTNNLCFELFFNSLIHVCTIWKAAAYIGVLHIKGTISVCMWMFLIFFNFRIWTRYWQIMILSFCLGHPVRAASFARQAQVERARPVSPTHSQYPIFGYTSRTLDAELLEKLLSRT